MLKVYHKNGKYHSCGEAGTSSVVVLCWCPIVVTCRLIIMCRILFMCCLPVTCRILLACRLPVASSSHVASSLRVTSPSRVACLHVSLSSGAVHGWWCWVFAASHGARPLWPFMAGGVVMSLYCGRVVRHRHRRCPWGGCSPLSSTHASAGLVCYPTIVLGLQTRSVRWEAMTMGWPLTFPSAHVTYVAWVLCLFTIMLALSSWGSKQGQ